MADADGDVNKAGAGAAPGTGEGKDDGALLAQQPRWQSPVFIAGIAVGLLLTTIGFGSGVLTVGEPLASKMMLSVGLGLVLGAFGAMAVVRYQGLTLTGVAALALVLFWTLTPAGPALLKIVLKPVPADIEPSMYIGHAVPGSRNGRDHFDFIVLDSEIAESTIELTLVRSDKTEVPFHCIPVDRIRSMLRSGRTLEWVLERDQSAVWIDRTSKVEANCGSSPLRVSSARTGPEISFIGAAMAQDSVGDIPVLLSELESDDAALRHDARAGLASLGTLAIRPMMEFWKQDPGNYRRALGVSVALTEFLRDHKDQAASVSALLTPPDYDLLIAAAGHNDRTMRVYATEFLFDLGAPASVDPIVDAFATASQDGQFNSVFVLGNVVPKLTAQQKSVLASEFASVTPVTPVGSNTRQALDNLLANLKQ